MSCMGIDIGYQFSIVAVPKGGGIEVVLNDYSKRCTPSCISFGEKMRTIGESGKQRVRSFATDQYTLIMNPKQAVTAYKNTITFFKSFIGRKYYAPDVQKELQRSFFKHHEMPDGTVGIEVEHAGETIILSIPQIVAMLLAHLRRYTERAIATKVEDAVLGVPVYFNDAQRHAMLDALKIANINCLRLLNETTAVALNYGIYKQGLPAAGEVPRRVVFFDFGHSNLQMSLCELVKGRLAVITTAFERVGGRDFDLALLDEMAKRFKEKTKIDFREKPRPFIRMEGECEKLKKMMSANATEIPMNVECLVEDHDFTTKMNRAEFEELCEPIFGKVKGTIERFVHDLEKREIPLSSLHSIEIIGGSCRIPLVKQMLIEKFGLQPQTTLNCDEAVARGCALMSAILSPMFCVRDFKVDDTTPYAINLHWPSANPSEGENKSEIFLSNSQANITKLLTFHRKQDLEFYAQYAKPETVPDNTLQLGNFQIKGVKPSYDDAAQKVKIEVQLDHNGCIGVRSAVLMDKLPPQEENAKDGSSAGEDNKMDTSEDKRNSDETPQTAKSADTSAEAEASGEKDANNEASKASTPQKEESEKKSDASQKKKKAHKKIPLTVISSKPCLRSDKDLNELVETEAKLAVQDLHEKEKNDARNALEEYIYEMRDKLSSSYEEFIDPKSGDDFKSRLSSMEDWLYDEGEEQPKTVYMDKLQALRVTGDDVKARAVEWELRPSAEAKLRRTIEPYRTFLEEHARGDEKYAHLSSEDVQKVSDIINSSEEWLNTKLSEQASRAKSLPPVITSQELIRKSEEIDRTCRPIVNKPKPKVEPPKSEETQQNGPTDNSGNTGDSSNDSAPQNDANSQSDPSNDKSMETD